MTATPKIHMTQGTRMKAKVILRVSSSRQKDRYGPAAQLADVKEGASTFPLGTLEIDTEPILIQERATGWNRKQWDEVMDEALAEFRRGVFKVLVFPRVDRETRFIANSLPKLLEIIKAGMLVYFAREKLLLDPNDPDTFEEYQREALEAQAYIRVFKRNTIRGRKEAARAGQIASGFGPSQGQLGLRYDKGTKTLKQVPGQIDIAEEILRRALKGDTSSEITRDLQKRSVRGPAGGRIHRSSVSRVLSHAKVYAGIYTWSGIEIRDKVEKPIITEEEANLIAQRLERNKKLSYGAGKRKPLTGRIFCGLCGRKYYIDSRKGCHCYGSESCNYIRCPAPRVGMKRLNYLVFAAIGEVLSDDEALVRRVAEIRKSWEIETKATGKKLQATQAQLYELGKRRRQLSFQHESGGLSDEEYLQRLKSLRSDELHLHEQEARLRSFTSGTEPPAPEEFRQMLTLEKSPGGILAKMLMKATPLLKVALAKTEERDKLLQEITEYLDVKATIYPDSSEEGLKLDVFVNLPTTKHSIGDIPEVTVSPSS